MQQRHGSGKTAVLVERIIKKIIDDNIDVDNILVVTFTNSVASEMRERVLQAIYKKIEENPNDVRLQKQINLLNKANICTIDSFCLDIIRNHFYEIDIAHNTRIADNTEIELLKLEVLEDIFEEKYLENNKDFLELIDIYTKYNKDEDLQKLILKIYSYIQTDPFPEEWLNNKIEMFNLNKKEIKNFSNTKWGKIIVSNAENILENCILRLRKIEIKMQRFSELEKFKQVIEQDILNYINIKENLNNWDIAVTIISELKNKKWPTDKKVTNELKDEAKQIRDKVKKDFLKIKELIPYLTQETIKDMDYVYQILLKLESLIIEFSNKFYNKKREKNIIDFNDMEHLALKILIKKDANGNIIKTDIAKKYENKFQEIAIDEYQDSNLVQEFILNSISRGNNIFQVGDVKQSIYKFRQARPELFLNKYDSYKLEPEENQDRKIQLFKNFRSRKNILDITNIIFKNIMSKDLGNIEYDESEYLNLGALYDSIENQNLKTQIEIIDLEEENTDIWKEENTEDEEPEVEEDQEERIENVVLEARFVANKIKKLIDSKYQIIDKKIGKKNIKFKDIAVLLRSPNSVAPIYEKELSNLGINVYSDTGTTYLQSIEIDTIMAVLKIINNPMQDIPLVTVMRSNIGNFTDNDLLEISIQDKKMSFYEKLLRAEENTKNKNLKLKIKIFLDNIKIWKESEEYLPLNELIWKICTDTGYIDYVSLMPNGQIRVANLRMLFEKAKNYETINFKGLFEFINFIEKIKFNNGDLSSAKIIGENENVVKIMSIHKSKGLEFPVVILAGTGKSFNFQDLNNEILLHQDLGLGPEYINAKRYIRFNTLAKKSISIISKREIISEEMRVLYVALTRAKEKLIIIGTQKNVNEKLSEKQKNLEIYSNKEKINTFLIQKYKTYLDWLELIYLKEGIENTKDIFDIKIYSKTELIKQINLEKEDDDILKKLKLKTNNINIDEEKQIRKILEWKYNFCDLENIPTKTSVTQIKELAQKEKKEELSNITIMPKFLMKNKKQIISNTQKGTLMHLCVQKMNEKEDYTIKKIKEFIQDLIDRSIISEVEAISIDVKKLYEYTKSDLWNNIKNAKYVYKEQPFYINIPAKQIYETSSEENVLVQGVIDLYYINTKGEITLVDYKTDYITIENKNKLIEEYKEQLDLYKRALEEAIGKKVTKELIYSLYLNMEIE